MIDCLARFRDLVVDSSGAVVIPPGDLDQVLAEARSIEADDARYRAEIQQERTIR